MKHTAKNIDYIVAKSKKINLYFDEYADFTIYFKDGEIRNYNGHLPKYADDFFDNHTCYVSKVKNTKYRVYVRYIPNWLDCNNERENYLNKVYSRYPLMQGVII